MFPESEQTREDETGTLIFSLYSSMFFKITSMHVTTMSKSNRFLEQWRLYRFVRGQSSLHILNYPENTDEIT